MELQEEFSNKLEQVTDIHNLHQLKAQFVGKKGLITQELKKVSTMSIEQKKEVGFKMNELKKFILEQIQKAEKKLSFKKVREKLYQNLPDPSLSVDEQIGHIHPLRFALNTIIDFFIQQGFDVADGPQIETNYHNFEALNIEEDHPARLMHDSFYLKDFDDGVLRTHTSPVQSRYLEKHKPPLRMIAPGRVYRCDNDPTHSPMFHQVEGLVLDTSSTLQDLKEMLSVFLSTFFEEKVKTRFRPSYFPFTEPSLEVDIGCFQCSGDGCSLCKNSGWLEVLGCGLVHPNVLDKAGIDSTKIQGYAFGLGVERLAMLKYGISDLRLFYENHLDFLKQF